MQFNGISGYIPATILLPLDHESQTGRRLFLLSNEYINNFSYPRTLGILHGCTE
jgi:hypothetical protein